MASIYQRGKVWWLKFHLNGKRIQQSLHTTNKRIALDRKKQIEYQIATRGLVQPSQTPLTAFLEEYCQHLQGIRTRKAYKNDISYLRTFFGPVCASLQPGNTCNTRKDLRKKKPKIHDPLRGRHVQATLLEEITTETIAGFISRRVREDGIAAKTANRLREVLHRMFAYAVKDKGYRGSDGHRSNPVAAVDRRREPAGSIRFLNVTQIDEQLEVFQDKPILGTMVATLIYAGLRREEVLWLTANDVDLDRRVIRICAKTVEGEFWQPKTKRNRVVPISSALLDILSGYFPRRACPWLFPSTRLPVVLSLAAG